MGDRKIEYLAEHTNDTRHIDVPTMLGQVQEEYGRGERTAKQGLFISLDNTDGQYHTRFCSVGLKCSEVVALIEYVKDDMIRHMKEPL